MRKIAVFTLVFLAMSILYRVSYARDGGDKMTNNIFQEIYQESTPKEGVREISYEQLLKIKNSGEKHVIFDVLSKDSYREGHIEGAVSFPLGEINKETAEKMIPQGANIVVYCGSFLCKASTHAAEKLSSFGYKVLDYKGGLQEWQEKGNKLVK